MKSDVCIVSVKDVLDGFDLVVCDQPKTDENPLGERKPVEQVCYIAANGDFCENGIIRLTADEITEKVGCTDCEPIKCGDKFKLMCYNYSSFLS